MFKSLTIIGNVGNDPVERSVKGTDKTFVTFDIAVNTKFNGKETTDWIELSCNGYWAELALKYIKKGTKLFVVGEPEFSAYLSKEDKEPRSSIKMFVREMRLLSGGNFSEENAEVQS